MLYSVSDPFLQTFYGNYKAEIGGDYDTFVTNIFDRDEDEIERMASMMYEEKYEHVMPRDEYDKVLGLNVWREEQPSGAAITAHRTMDRVTNLLGGTAQSIQSASEFLSQSRPTAAYDQYPGGQAIRNQEQRRQIEEYEPSGGLGFDKAAKTLRDHEFEFEDMRATSWEDFMEKPFSRRFAQYAVEEAIVSLPDMVAAIASLPLYAAARTGEIAGERAENDLREDATVGDFLAALPAASSSAALERIGASKLFGITDDVAPSQLAPDASTVAKVADAAKRGGSALGRRIGIEGLTEATQEPIEQIGANLGTEAWRGKPTADVVGELQQSALQGGVTGAMAGGVIAGPTTAAETILKSRREQADNELNNVLNKATQDAKGDKEVTKRTKETKEQINKVTKGQSQSTATETDVAESGSKIRDLSAEDRSVQSFALEKLAEQGKRMVLQPGDLSDGQRVTVDNGISPPADGVVKIDGDHIRIHDDDGNMIGSIRTDATALPNNPLVYSTQDESATPERMEKMVELQRLINNYTTGDEAQQKQALEGIQKIRNSADWEKFDSETKEQIESLIRDGDAKEQERVAKEQEEKDKKEQEELEKSRETVKVGDDIEVVWDEDSQTFMAKHLPTGKIFTAGANRDVVVNAAITASNDPEFGQSMTDSPQKPQPKKETDEKSVVEPDQSNQIDIEKQAENESKIEEILDIPRLQRNAGWLTDVQKIIEESNDLQPKTAVRVLDEIIDSLDREGPSQYGWRTMKRVRDSLNNKVIDQETLTHLAAKTDVDIRNLEEKHRGALEKWGLVKKRTLKQQAEDWISVWPEDSLKSSVANIAKAADGNFDKMVELFSGAYPVSKKFSRKILEVYEQQLKDAEKTEDTTSSELSSEQTASALNHAQVIYEQIAELDANEEGTEEYDDARTILETMTDGEFSSAFNLLPEEVQQESIAYAQSGSGSIRALTEFINSGAGRESDQGEDQGEDDTETLETEEEVEVEDTEDEVDENDPPENLAVAVLDNLKNDVEMDNPSFFALADEAFGGTVGEGVYDAQQAYNIMEYAMNKLAAEVDMRQMGIDDAIQIANTLDAKHKLLPTQTRRTDTKIDFQQFSTPPGYAMAVAWAAGIYEGQSVLEPSAGSGSLAIMAKQMGGNVTVNELETGRQEILMRQFGEDGVWVEDANFLPSIKSGQTFDRIIMNPPFSSEGERKIKKKGVVTEAHVLAAMKMLAPGGRLVIISGPKFDVTKSGVVSSAMKKDGMIRAVVDMEGNKLYRKYGTSFDNKVTVFDKTAQGQQEATGGMQGLVDENMLGGRLIISVPKSMQSEPEQQSKQIVQGSFDNLEDFIRAMEPVRELANLQIAGGKNGNTTGTGSTDQNRSVAQDGSGTTVLGDTGESGGGNTTKGDGGTTGTSMAAGGGSRTGQRGSQSGSTTSGTDTVGSPPNRQLSSQSDSSTVGGRREDGRPSGREGESERSNQPNLGKQSSVNANLDLEDNQIFAKYKPTVKTNKNAVEHPGKLVESASMATVNYPSTIDYVPNLPEEIIKEGNISVAQLEKVILAGYAHSLRIGNGTFRKGFLDGDGTGVGKGRSIVATIYDNYNQGRKKAIWFSISANLVNSAKADFDGVGWKDAKLIPGTKRANWNKLGNTSEGIFFSTYSQLSTHPTASEKQDQRRRWVLESSLEVQFPKVKQIVDWVGEDFDGIIVFDEAHRMKGAMDVVDADSGYKKEASRMGRAGIALQNALPNARIYYATATSATEPENLGYLTRLGLWGEGTDFQDARHLVNAVRAGGTAAMELVSRDLKQLGVFASRSLSTQDVEYERLTHIMTKDQIDMYDKSAKTWQMAMEQIDDAWEVIMPNANFTDRQRQRGQAQSAFWGANMRFWGVTISAMQMPTVIEDARKQMEDGNAVIFQIVNTNEAIQKRQLAKAAREGLGIEDVDITPRSVLLDIVDRYYPTNMLMQVAREDRSGTEWVPVLDSEGNPVQDPGLVEKKAEVCR